MIVTIDGKEKSVCRTDTDGLYYLSEDLEWVFPPSEDDPGVTGPKSGAIPVDIPENEI